jgi:hypothetical protein
LNDTCFNRHWHRAKAERKCTMSNETKVEKVKTQISWGTLGTKLYADMPVSNERLWFDMGDLHETWKDFLLMYGVRQYVSSNISGESFPFKAEYQAAVKTHPDATDIEILAIVREVKSAWLKDNVNNLRTALWKELEVLKVEKTKKEKADRETKAALEARVAAETKAKMLDTMRANMAAQGMDEATINILLANV